MKDSICPPIHQTRREGKKKAQKENSFQEKWLYNLQYPDICEGKVILLDQGESGHLKSQEKVKNVSLYLKYRQNIWFNDKPNVLTWLRNSQWELC